MEKELYEQIFRRRSFHTFKDRSNETITQKELEEIKEAFKSFDSLDPTIKVEIKIVPVSEVTTYAKGEYAILIYSQEKEHYLQNVGYIGQQLDLYLAKRNIGACWFGIGKEEEIKGDLKYVIKFIIAKVGEDKFRKDISSIKRKNLSETFKGEMIEGVIDIARLSPSAVNAQPWFVEHKDNQLLISRYTKKTLLVDNSFFNQVDIGIYMCILELCLINKGIEFKRELFLDSGKANQNILNAIYTLKN